MLAKKPNPLKNDQVFMDKFKPLWLETMSKWEGVRYKMYKDIYGHPTIGIGHLIQPHEKHLLTATLTKEQVHEIFWKDSQWAIDTVLGHLNVTPFNLKQLVAYCSLCFNYGPAGFKKLLHVNMIKKGWPETKEGWENLYKTYTRPLNNPQLVGRRKKEWAFMTS